MWKITQLLVTEYGRYECEPKFIPAEQFSAETGRLEKQGYQYETYPTPLGEVQMYKYDDEGRLSLVTLEYTEGGK